MVAVPRVTAPNLDQTLAPASVTLPERLSWLEPEIERLVFSGPAKLSEAPTAAVSTVRVAQFKLFDRRMLESLVGAEFDQVAVDQFWLALPVHEVVVWASAEPRQPAKRSPAAENLNRLLERVAHREPLDPIAALGKQGEVGEAAGFIHEKSGKKRNFCLPVSGTRTRVWRAG